MMIKPTRYGFGFLSLALLVLMTYIECAKAATGGHNYDGILLPISFVFAILVSLSVLLIRVIWSKYFHD